MFRSMSNFKGMTFDEEEEDPGSCISNAAMGFHNEEMSPFLTTSIPHDKKEKIEFRITPYGSTDSLIDNKVYQEIDCSDDRASNKLSHKKTVPEPMPHRLKANNNEIRMKRQELGLPIAYGLRKSPVSRRRINKGISLDLGSYPNGEYFRDNYGNIYVHTLLPRATTFDTSHELNSEVNPKVFNVLKSSIRKWKQNLKTRQDRQNDCKKGDMSCSAEIKCTGYVELQCAGFDNGRINCTETRPTKPLHNAKLERTERITEGDLDVIQDTYFYSDNNQDKAVTERNKKENIKSKSSKKKQDKDADNFESIAETPETCQNKYETSYRFSSIGKGREVLNDKESLSSVKIDQGRVQIPSDDFNRIRKLRKERDSEIKMMQKRDTGLAPDFRNKNYIKTYSSQPRLQCFTDQSVRYFTVIEDDKKKYVSSLNLKLK